MKYSAPRIDAFRVGDTVESLKKALVEPVSRTLFELQAMLTAGLTFGDNFKCAIIERDLVHGVEMPITLGFKPIGVYALRSEALGTSARYAIESLDWQPDATGGTIGVTARYALDHTAPYLFARKSANQTIADATPTTVTWDTLVAAPTGSTLTSGVIYVSSTTTIKVTEPGLYRVEAKLSYAANVTGRRVAYQLQTSGVGTGAVPGINGQSATITGPDYQETAATYVLSTSDNVIIWTTQSSGGNLDLLGNQNYDCTLRVTRLLSLNAPTNTVTLLCVGG